MKFLRRLLRNCSSLVFLLSSFFFFSASVFARVDVFTPVDFFDCSTDGPSCDTSITGTDLLLISSDDGDNYGSSIWPDSLFAFSDETAWNDDDNPYLMQFNFNPTITDDIVKADFVFDGVFSPDVCSTFSECRFKLLSSVDGFSTSGVKLHGQSDLVISSPLISEIPSVQLGSLDSLSVKLLAYGTPFGDSAGVQSIIDQVKLSVTVDTGPPTDPVLESPIGGAYINDNTPLMQWGDSTDDEPAIKNYLYRIYYNCSDPLSVPSSCSSSYTDTNVPVSELQAGTTPDNTFFWQVRAVDGTDKMSDWSGLEEFTIDTIAPSQPVITSPADGLLTNINAISVEWTGGDDVGSKASGIEGYYLRYVFSPADGGPDIAWSSGLKPGNPKIHSGSYGHGEGTYVIYLKTVDKAGNESPESDSLTVTYDASAPVVTLNTPVAGYVKGSVVINGSVEDHNPHHYWLAIYKDSTGSIIDGLGTVPETNPLIDHDFMTWDTTLVANGSYTIVLSARDALNQKDSGSTVRVTVIVDNEAPSKPTGLKFLGKDHVTEYQCGAIIPRQVNIPVWTANTEPDFSHYEYSSFHPSGAQGLNEKVLSTATLENNWMPPTDGAYGYAVRSVDLAGNKSGWSLTDETLGGSCQIIYDSTYPVVGITSPSDGDKIKGIIDIRGFVTDANLSHYNISIYPGGVDVHDFSLRLEGQTVYGPEFTEKSIYSWDSSSYPQGEYQIRLAARDLAGNRQLGGVSEHVITVEIDNTPPVITFDQPLTTSVHSGVIHLQASCDEECDYVNFWWREESEAYLSASKRYHYVHTNGTVFGWDLDTLNAEKADGTFYTLSDGTYYLYAAGKDVIGNWAKTSEISIIVDNTNPTVAITYPLDTQVISGTTTVTVDANDLTSGIDYVNLSYRAVGDLTWIPLDTLTTSPYTYDWNTTGYPLGDYELMAEAFDLAGNSASTQIEVGVAAVISGESGSTPHFGEIYVSWFTDRPTTARVVYDTVPHPIPNLAHLNYGYAFSTSVFDLGKTTFHETLLTGLNDQTTYYYRFISAGSPAAISGEMMNRTLSMAGPGSSSSGGGGGASTLLATPSVLGTSTYYYTPTGSTSPDEGEVLGEETETSPEEEKSAPVITTPTPKILGAFTSVSPFYLFGAGLLISLILMILLFRRE